MTTSPVVEGLEVVATPIDGLVVLSTKSVTDDRGTVREFFRTSAFDEHGLARGPWQQVNVTESQPGSIRGLHGEHMTKLVGIVSGEAFGAYVDARPASPSFGTVVTVELHLGVQVVVPAGVCNGFQSVGDARTQYLYCFDSEWTPDMPGVGVDPLDAGLAIPWPITIDPQDRTKLSAKDAALPGIAELAARP